jgi:methyl-accepting chemotaxis protein
MVLLVARSFLGEGKAEGLSTALQCLVVIALITINYFLPYNKYLKGLFFALTPGVAIVILLLVGGYELSKHYLVMATLTMAALYFKKELLIIFACVMDVLFIAFYIINPENMVGSGDTLISFASVLIIFNGAFFLLYFLTSWGRNLVNEAKQKEAKAQDMLSRLNATFQNIEEGTNTLDTTIHQFNSNIHDMSEASKSITASMQEMAKAIQEEASSVYQVNNSMCSTIHVVHETEKSSREIASKSCEMIHTVEIGWEKIGHLKHQMNIVTDAIGTGTDTVTKLKDNMEKINQLLEDITYIARQTNLLAVNASIESARAGEQGKGFAVVAEEVKRLAGQSSAIVNNISAITAEMFNMSNEAYVKVKQGDTAAMDGSKVVDEISVSFEEIRQAFEGTNAAIQVGLQKNSKMTEEMENVQRQIEGVASISEENSAATQEVLATIESENADMAEFGVSVQEIQALSGNLRKLLVSQ